MKIEFIEAKDEARLFYTQPQPSKKYIPNWYKEAPMFIDESKTKGISKENSYAANTTFKSCIPFLDALSLGYTWSLPADIEIIKDEKNINFKWRTDDELITLHSPEQHKNFPPPFDGYDFIFKWTFSYTIKTPPGYSTFFTHPLNRHDLPFRTFSGVVDTDKYVLPVQFPSQWLIQEDKSVILEKGTPLCQFFPFKRDKWESKKIDYNLDREKRMVYNLREKIVNSYKKQFWTKKEFY